MELKLSEGDDRSRNAKRAYTEKSEESDLIFSFDSDSETGHDTLDTAPQQPRDKSPSYSISLPGHTTTPWPDDSINRGYPLTDTHTSSSSDQGQISRRDSKRNPEIPLTSSLHLLPPGDNSDNQASIASDSSSLHLSVPHDSAACTPIPEPTTPRTRRFKDDMLSMLSLLPPGRYLSPSPCIEEDQFGEADTGECGLDACAMSPILSTHATTVDCSSSNRSLVSPDGSPERFLVGCVRV